MIGILSNIFGTGEVVKKGLDLIDEAWTSDEEKAETGAPQGVAIGVNGATVAYTTNSFSNGGLYQGYRQNLTAIVPARATYSI